MIELTAKELMDFKKRVERESSRRYGYRNPLAPISMLQEVLREADTIEKAEFEAVMRMSPRGSHSNST